MSALSELAVQATSPAYVAGQITGSLLFLVGGVLLLIFGIRRLNERSRARRAQQFQPQPGPGGYPGPLTGAGPPYHPSSPLGRPVMPPAGHDDAKKPPSLTISIIMLVVGVLLLLALLSSLANAASTVG